MGSHVTGSTLGGIGMWMKRMSAAAAMALTAAGAQAAEPPVATGEPPAVEATGRVAIEEPEASRKPKLEAHGGAYLWYHSPMITGQENDLRFAFANLTLSGSVSNFGAVVDTRFKNQKLRDPDETYIWMNEGYAFWQPRPGMKLKAGKIMSRFGRYWDETFYCNLPFNDGLSLVRHWGISGEGVYDASSKLDVDYAAQNFVVDGKTSGILGQDPPDTEVVRKRNMVSARVMPTYHVTERLDVSAAVSGQTFDIDAPGFGRASRVAVETSVKYGPAMAFAEVVQQIGQGVPENPLTPANVTDATYVWTGAGYVWENLDFRYNFSIKHRRFDDSTEIMHMPAVVAELHENVSLWTEFVLWQGKASPERPKTRDRSLNLIVQAHF